MKVFVTATGVNSAIGTHVNECLLALTQERSGLGSCDIFDHKTLYVGRVDQSNDELRKRLGLPNANWPRTALLGLLAAQEAFKGNPDSSVRKGFINGTTTGGMDLTEQHYGRPEEARKTDGWKVVATHDLGVVTALIAQQLSSFDYINTISTACSSSANSIMLGARMIRNGSLDQVLAGGCDALTSFTINGFKSLMIYANDVCRPFDQHRLGLNLGEGAGYLLLENEKSLASSGNTVLAELTGWANTNDAFHQTGTSEEGTGAKLAMIRALEKSGLAAEKIDYLNAHGTATNNNDKSEMAAIDAVFDHVDFSSTKGFTGHTLGASGGIEAVFSMLSLQHQQAWVNKNLNESLNEGKIDPLGSDLPKKINHVMSNSFGFGGNSTSLIFTKN